MSKVNLSECQSVLSAIGNTPLVALSPIAKGVRNPVLVKCEHLNPGGSIKDRIAKAIAQDAEARGGLKPGMTLIEATAGNTGVGLALVAAVRGYRLVCVMPEKMCVDKRVSLSALTAVGCWSALAGFRTVPTRCRKVETGA